MLNRFSSLFAEGEERQISANQTPNVPNSRKKRSKCMERVVFSIVYMFEVLLHVTAYGAIFWMSLVGFVAIIVSVLLTSPVWIPCGIMCLPSILVILLLCKFTTIPSRSANSVKESSLVKKISWNSIFGTAKA